MLDVRDVITEVCCCKFIPTVDVRRIWERFLVTAEDWKVRCIDRCQLSSWLTRLLLEHRWLIGVAKRGRPLMMRGTWLMLVSFGEFMCVDSLLSCLPSSAMQTLCSASCPAIYTCIRTHQGSSKKSGHLRSADCPCYNVCFRPSVSPQLIRLSDL